MAGLLGYHLVGILDHNVHLGGPWLELLAFEHLDQVQVEDLLHVVGRVGFHNVRYCAGIHFAFFCGLVQG